MPIRRNTLQVLLNRCLPSLLMAAMALQFGQSDAQTVSGLTGRWHTATFLYSGTGSFATYTYIPATSSVDVMIVSAGGGGGGGACGTGGGGGGGAAGWALPRTSYAVTPGNSLTINVGRGGPGSVCDAAGIPGGFLSSVTGGLYVLPVPPPGGGGSAGHTSSVPANGGSGGIERTTGSQSAFVFAPLPQVAPGTGNGSDAPYFLTDSYPFVQGSPGGNGGGYDNTGTPATGGNGGDGQNWDTTLARGSPGSSNGGGGGGGGGSLAGRGAWAGQAYDGTDYQIPITGNSCTSFDYGAGGGGGGADGNAAPPPTTGLGNGGNGCPGMVVIWEYY